VIEGALVRLRLWQEDDVPAIMALRNDVALQAKLLARARGSDQSQVRKWLEDRSTAAGNMLFIVAQSSNDAPLGYLQFTGIDPVDLNAELGICLATAAQGRGFGGEALQLALSHLRDTVGIRKISLRVRTDNTVAIRAYRRLGFSKCGELKDHIFIDGRWQNVLLMELFLQSSSSQ
jgi:RimJ/RimL family protein N-acetyltransferase